MNLKERIRDSLQIMKRGYQESLGSASAVNDIKYAENSWTFSKPLSSAGALAPAILY